MNYRLVENSRHSHLTTSELLECMDANTEILKHFRCDLYADYVSIVQEDERETPKKFWWVVRECGTWFRQKYDNSYDIIFMQSMVDNYSRYQVYVITHHSYNDWTITRELNTLFESIINK